MAAAVRWLYAIALGLFVVMTVGFGLVTFFPDPPAPEYPSPGPVPRAVPAGTTPTPGETARQAQEQAQAQQEYDRARTTWEDDRRAHRRVALAIVTLVALGCLVAGVILAPAVDVLAIGLMLGALFSLGWGLAYAASEAGSGTMFGVALIALVVMIAIGTPQVRRRLHTALPR